jgi:CheY-like chemotaxis protein
MALKINKALVVDDSRLARIALSKLLAKREIAADVAGDAGEALEYLRSQRPDVVFMDYMMPDMDGFEASRQVLALVPELPIVMYTSQDTPKDRARAAEVGIRGFLCKPSSDDELTRVLDALQSGAAVPVAVAPAASVPESVAARPSAAPSAPPPLAPSGALPWEEIRSVAREAAVEAARRISNEGLAHLRGELDRHQQASPAEPDPAHVRALAEGAARELARQVAAEVAERIARSISEQSMEAAREAAGRTAEAAVRAAAEAAAPAANLDAVRPLLDGLRDEFNAYSANLASSRDFRTQVKGMLFEHLLPSIQETLQPQIQASARAAFTALTEQQDAAQENELVELREELASLRLEIDGRVRSLQQRVRLLGIGGGVAVAVGIALIILL